MSNNHSLSANAKKRSTARGGTPRDQKSVINNRDGYDILTESPIKHVKLCAVLLLPPSQITPDIEQNIYNETMKMENKSTYFTLIVDNTDGTETKSRYCCFLRKILNIVSTGIGKINSENFRCDVEFMVTFMAEIISPTTDSYIVACIDNINDAGAIQCVNGPMRIFVPFEKINTNRFIITKTSIYDNQDNITVSVGDYIIVQILALKYLSNTMIIPIVGTIVRLFDKNKEGVIDFCEKQII